jgi:DNA-binding ferritin-like protein (Dps family)
MPKYKAKKPRGKQHNARAASFKRIAKELWRHSHGYGPESESRLILSDIASIFEEEATKLRSMR